MDPIIRGQRTNFLDHSIIGHNFLAIKAGTKKTSKKKKKRNERTVSMKLT
jgi:hypothetical protein